MGKIERGDDVDGARPKEKKNLVKVKPTHTGPFLTQLKKPHGNFECLQFT